MDVRLKRKLKKKKLNKSKLGRVRYKQSNNNGRLVSQTHTQIESGRQKKNSKHLFWEEGVFFSYFSVIVWETQMHWNIKRMFLFLRKPHVWWRINFFFFFLCFRFLPRHTYVYVQADMCVLVVVIVMVCCLLMYRWMMAACWLVALLHSLC